MSTETPRSTLTAFDYRPRTRVIFGPGSVQQAGTLARELGGGKLLLVTDKGLVKAGHAERILHILEVAGRQVIVFADAEENPTNRCVQKCAEAARGAGIDLIIGLGGGSSMDTAKGCNFVLTNGGDMKDYRGIGKAPRPMLPFIAIPTTGGTGSECQSFALITDAETHEKMACGDPKAAARIAILDPMLTLSQPPRVTACTGTDALTHAVESAVSRKRNPVSNLYAQEAFRLIVAGFSRVLKDPADLEARGFMQLAAAWAGVAIENSMLGAAHAAANPLTARFGVVHGQAVGMLLPHVIRFNASDPDAHRIYSELAGLAGFDQKLRPASEAPEFLAHAVERLLRQAGMSRSLSELGVAAGDILVLAESATRQWTAQFNPRSVNQDDFASLYQEAFAPRRCAHGTRGPGLPRLA